MYNFHFLLSSLLFVFNASQSFFKLNFYHQKNSYLSLLNPHYSFQKVIIFEFLKNEELLITNY